MNTYTLKNCQQHASDDLYDKYLQFHNNKENKKIYFQAPTGSGKTLILCDLCNKIMMHNNKCIILFISISTGDIQDQNFQKALLYQKAKNYDYHPIPITSPSKNISKSDDDIMYDQQLVPEPKGVYFMGSSTYTRTSIYSKQKIFDKLIEEANAKGYEIIYIRDEAHIGTKKDNNPKRLDDLLNKYANVTYYVSATLEQQYEHLDVEIKEMDAVNDGLIKGNLIAFAGVTSNENISNDELLEKALTKLINVKKQYLKAANEIGQLINPCLLIQIKNNKKATKKAKETKADKKGESEKDDSNKVSEEDKFINSLVNTIKKFHLHYLVYTDSRKDSDTRLFTKTLTLTPNEKYQITKNDSSIDVIIFKVALATGWDIPRANMLLQLRDIYSDTLNIQTIGRIRRNPLARKLKLNKPEKVLNDYYIYSNAPKVKEEEYQWLKRNSEVIAFKNFATVILKEEQPAQNESANNQEYVKKFYDDLIANFKTKKIFAKSNEGKTYHEWLKIINNQINENNKYPLVRSELYLTQDQKQKASLITDEIVNTLTAEKYWKERILSFNDDEFTKIINEFVKQYSLNESLNEFAIKLFLLDYNYHEAFAHIVDEYNQLIAHHRYYYEASPIFSLPQTTIEYLTEVKKANCLELKKEFRKFLYWVPDEENNDKLVNKKVDEEIYSDSQGEQHFIKDMLDVLNKIDAKESKFQIYLLKNYLNNSTFRYEYIDKQPLEKKRSHFPDFIIEYNDETYVCEIKSDTMDYDENKTNELENAYLEYSNINKYHYLIIKWNGSTSSYSWNHYFNGRKNHVDNEINVMNIFQ